MKKFKIIITTGDINGIGPEVTFKALDKISVDKAYQYIIFKSKLDTKSSFLKLNQKYKLIEVNSLAHALSQKEEDIIIISSEDSPPRWVELSAKACMENICDALVTAPLSKTEIIKSGYNMIGHTELLKTIANVNSVYMTFLGNHFNVLLLTGHIPLKEVPNYINKDHIENAIQAAQSIVNLLSEDCQKKPLGFIGLNPHAGEGGLIGLEDLQLIRPILKDFNKKDVPIEGPLVPDAAFLRFNWNKYSMYISPFHDQGLTAFKIVHGHESGVHITFGLPFIRTSVNHGTAKDIFGKNIAKPNSMIDAIFWAKKLIHSNIRKIDKQKIKNGEKHHDSGSCNL